MTAAARYRNKIGKRASGGNRTRDLFLTKEARYRYATEAPTLGLGGFGTVLTKDAFYRLSH